MKASTAQLQVMEDTPQRTVPIEELKEQIKYVLLQIL